MIFFVKNKFLTTILKLLFSSICLFLVFYFVKIDFNNLLLNLKTVDLVWFILAYIITVLIFIISSFRWQIILNEQNHKIPITALMKYYFIGGFFNTFLPSSVGGDIIRSYYLKKNNIGFKKALSSVFIERLLGISALILLTSLSLIIRYFFFDKINMKIIVSFLLFVFLFLIIWFMYFNLTKLGYLLKKIFKIFPDNIYSKIDAFIEILKLTGTSKKRLARGFLISLVAHLFTIFVVYCLALSLGIQIGFIHFLIFVPIITILSMIPITINGIGVRESGYVFFFVPLGVLPSKSITLSILFYFLTILIGLIGALFYSFNNFKFKKKALTKDELNIRI